MTGLPKLRRSVVAAGMFCALVVAAGCSAAGTDPQELDVRDAVGASPLTYAYSGVGQVYTVPSGVTMITITATGGGGGIAMVGPSAPGAQVTGSLPVQPGQVLLIGVGGKGASAGSKDDDPLGGWGALGARGGNGNAAYDADRTSGAGGGATTVQLAGPNGVDPQTVLVAGGGGGRGGPSGDVLNPGIGGAAGCTAFANGRGTPSWTGSNGTAGSPGIYGSGPGGAAATEAGMAGERGLGGSGLGGNGGGGGGGVNGGAGGGGAKGTSAGGGGGAGSSITYGMSNTAVSCPSAGGDGRVVITPVGD